ncbi:hypothetical protein P9112_008882 [Eukaryota sp. TZLM1-RC]
MPLLFNEYTIGINRPTLHTRKQLETLLESAGAEVVLYPTVPKVVVSSDSKQARNTKLFKLSLSNEVPIVSEEWVTTCLDTNTIASFDSFLLPEISVSSQDVSTPPPTPSRQKTRFRSSNGSAESSQSEANQALPPIKKSNAESSSSLSSLSLPRSVTAGPLTTLDTSSRRESSRKPTTFSSNTRRLSSTLSHSTTDIKAAEKFLQHLRDPGNLERGLSVSFSKSKKYE